MRCLKVLRVPGCQTPLNDLRDADICAFDIIAGETMLAAQIEHGLDRGMNPRGGGIALHHDVADVKTLNKAVEHMGDVELIRIRTEKAALALQDGGLKITLTHFSH